MPEDALLQEAKTLHRVSDRLDMIAENHPLISEALSTLSANVRGSATLLELLVTLKLGPSPKPD
jgi:hypothetical protein